MNYSTLREAYNIDSFEKDKRTKTKKKVVDEEVVFVENPEPEPVKVFKPISKVEPYYDEDLEKYLNINDFKSANTPYVPQDFDKPHQVRKEYIKQDPQPSQPQPSQQSQQPQPLYQSQPQLQLQPPPDVKQEPVVDKKDVFYKNLVNIGLFIFIGILIIFLCDQISEIAINLGMKKTVKILEPYLIKIQDRS